MLETRAIIVQLEGTEALVEARQVGGCGHCDSGNGCASGKLSKLFCVQPRRFKVHNGINAGVGEEVQVLVADGTLLRSALIMYMLPLVLLLVGGLLGGSLADGIGRRDAYSAIGALLGLAVGLVFARSSASPAAQPIIARCEGEHDSH
jgi:sigma-E factor negative regulatory protein RseC